MISGPIKMKNNTIKTGKDVIELQIRALEKLKNSIDSSFEKAIKVIQKCKSKVIICGVGKSGIIASKISATLSSVGTPSFSISASDCSHGDLGRITKNDVLILISNSGNTNELFNVIEYCKKNKIQLIGIVSNKHSSLYKHSNIKLLIPEVVESGFSIVPTSSTTIQLSIGDALAIALMNKKKFGKLDFKKFHPSGSLSAKLKTASDVMLTKNKIPFVNKNHTMKKALKVLNLKKLGFIVVVNDKRLICGIFTDGDLKRILQKKINIQNLKISSLITKNPFIVEENMLVSEILNMMNRRKITNTCVFKKGNKRKIIGVIHIHDLLKIRDK